MSKPRKKWEPQYRFGGGAVLCLSLGSEFAMNVRNRQFLALLFVALAISAVLSFVLHVAERSGT